MNHVHHNLYLGYPNLILSYFFEIIDKNKMDSIIHTLMIHDIYIF
jgi:hypothetical protein